VTLSNDNYSTYSGAYLNLLLDIGSEIDVIIKEYCKLLDESFSGENIIKYLECIKKHESEFFIQAITVYNEDSILTPWCNYNASGDIISPYWWTVYNKCKHNRTEIGIINEIKQEYYKFANLEYTLSALAGLYQVNLFLYKIVIKDANLKVEAPLPGSRLFKFKGEKWDKIEFLGDLATHFENGTLTMETAKIYY
jgi:hypothetical protein